MAVGGSVASCRRSGSSCRSGCLAFIAGDNILLCPASSQRLGTAPCPPSVHTLEKNVSSTHF